MSFIFFDSSLFLPPPFFWCSCPLIFPCSVFLPADLRARDVRSISSFLRHAFASLLSRKTLPPEKASSNCLMAFIGRNTPTVGVADAPSATPVFSMFIHAADGMSFDICLPKNFDDPPTANFFACPFKTIRTYPNALPSEQKVPKAFR